MSDLILSERDGNVALLRLNDPDRLNAMTEAMGHALDEAVKRLAGDESIRAVVITGEGRAFSAGGDLDMLQAKARAAAADPGGQTRDDNRRFMQDFYRLYLSVRDLPCPTVAALNGAAVGAGLCVALACDLRIAAREARLGLNFAKLGIHPGMGATWTLPRLVGPAHAAEILYTGRLLDGAEAERVGMVNRAVPRAEVLATARALAQEMAASSPLAVRGTKQALARSAGASLDEQLAFEAEQQALCYESADLAEGLAAVREKRTPVFGND